MRRFEEARSLLHRAITVARRVHGESHLLSLGMRQFYAKLLYEDTVATLDDLREALNTLEAIRPTARRAAGSAHPLAMGIEAALEQARDALRARAATGA